MGKVRFAGLIEKGVVVSTGPSLIPGPTIGQRLKKTGDVMFRKIDQHIETVRVGQLRTSLLLTLRQVVAICASVKDPIAPKWGNPLSGRPGLRP